MAGNTYFPNLISKLMSVRYKLVKKRNPQDPEGPQKWYATTNALSPLPERDMVNEATKNTTVSPGEFRLAIESLAEYAPTALRKGRTLKIPGIGTLRISFSSLAADTVEAFDSGSMIYSPRIVFTPEASFRAAVLDKLEFEDGGVLENGVSYASRADYKAAKAAAADEPSEP